MEDEKLTYRKRRLLTKENIIQGLQNPRKIPKSLYNRAQLSLLRLYYVGYHNSYLDFYLKATKSNVDQDPEGSVGPAELFEEVGEWQYALLKNKGLNQSDYLLDIGCGVLRGGIHFIDYLDQGHYYGMDVSLDTIKKGEGYLERYGLCDKNPTLINNNDLKFGNDKLKNMKFDYILAQSVFTHLPRREIKECLDNINKVLSKAGTFYATFNKSETENYTTRRGIDRYHTLEFYDELAAECGVKIEEIQSDHPNGLNLLKIENE